MYKRRDFLRQGALAAGAVLTAGSAKAISRSKLMGDAEDAGAVARLTILHTNDVHSRLEAFPMDGGRNQGLGGVSARAALIRQIRESEKHVLLLDAGDIFQGTPFFNLYKGEPEIKAMTAMGYDAATIGNHDFDSGLENLANQLQHAGFPIVNCNYDFRGTPMEYKAQPYKIFRKGNLKVGVLGVGIELKGLVPENLYGGIVYQDPLQKANEVADMLKRRENCDLIICLSHLGYKYGDNKISDVKLAANSENIDIVIGGHTHTFLERPDVLKNKKGAEVIVNQVGWAGINLGRLDVGFNKGRNKNLVRYSTHVIGEKTGE